MKIIKMKIMKIKVMIKNKCGALLVFVAQKLGTSNVQHIPRSARLDVSTLLSSDSVLSSCGWLRQNLFFA